MRFINDDVNLRHGIRKAAKISKKEFMEKVKEAVEKYDEPLEFMCSWEEHQDFDITFSVENETFSEFYEEHVQTNFGDTVIGFPLTGYQTLDNGLNFIGVQAGGDWEYPVFFIFYWDGEKLRGYIPHYRNPVNLDR